MNVGMPPAEGEETPDLSQLVPITNRDGSVEQVRAADLNAAMAEGALPATPAEVEAARDGTWGDIRAAVYGAARGMTFGLSDKLYVEGARALDGDVTAGAVREELDLTKRGHEGTSLGGELAGSLAGMFLLPGGAAKTVRSEGMLARAAERAANIAPRAFVEGAAMGAGQQLSEDTLQNHEAVGQAYLVAALKGGVLGALTAGALTAGGGAIADKLAARGGRAAEAIERTAYRTAAEVDDAGASGKTLLGRLSNAAEDQAFKSILPYNTLSANEVQKLGRTVEEQVARGRRIGRTVLDEVGIAPTDTKAKLAQKITAKVAETGDELGSIRRTLDKAKARPSAMALIERLDNEVVAPLMRRPFSEAEQAAVRPYIDTIVKRAGAVLEVGDDGITRLVPKRTTFEKFSDLFELRHELDLKLKKKAWDVIPGTESQATAEMKKIRGILEDIYEEGAERAAAELGEDLSGRYRVAKALYSDLKTAEKYVTKAAARASQHRAISLTDTVMAGAALASGHPIGILAPVANKLMRTFGNQTAASLLNRATRIEGLQRVSSHVDDLIDKSARSFFKGGSKVAEREASKSLGPEEARLLREAVKNPDALAARVEEAIGASGLHEDAPRVARAMTMGLTRAAMYISQRLPSEPQPAGLTFQKQRARKPDAMTQARQDAVINALDIEATIAEFGRGKIDRERIEALRIIAPEHYAKLQAAIRKYGMENEQELTIQQEAALSIVFGTPVSAMMQPSTVRGFQQTFAQGASPQQGPASEPASKRPLGPSRRPTSTAWDEERSP